MHQYNSYPPQTGHPQQQPQPQHQQYPPQQQQQRYGENMGSHQGQGQGQGQGQPQDFFKFQNVSPEMLQFGLSTGQDLLTKQRDRWMPGVSGFWQSLKIYFSVSNRYVLKKLSILAYPVAHKSWQRQPADEHFGGQDVKVCNVMLCNIVYLCLYLLRSAYSFMVLC